MVDAIETLFFLSNYASISLLYASVWTVYFRVQQQQSNVHMQVKVN